MSAADPVPEGWPDRAARAALVPDPQGGGGRLQPLAEDGTPTGPAARAADVWAAVAAVEARGTAPRWVWAAADSGYTPMLPGRVTRCHDLALTEALLVAHDGAFGQPRSLGAAWARLHGLPVPDDLGVGADSGDQDSLFAPDRLQLPPGTDPLTAVVAVHADQQRRVAALDDSDGTKARFRLLVAAESAGGLVAAEMAYGGLPWRNDVHDALLADKLGPRPVTRGALPAKLAETAQRLQEALGGRPFNADSHAQVIKAFADQGVRLASTRTRHLREIDHPAAEILIHYKELSRLHAAHGWAWQDAWVRGGRFRPEYVVGGVVSGRWAGRGGGALQIPRILRGAVVADPGWCLVVADASQVEPRVLAALSRDAGLARTAAEGDLYQALAAEAFGGDRDQAKLGLLGAMYGQTSGDIGPLLATLRRRYPAAMGYVEAAARTGEDGGLVRSVLGRTCPPPSAEWLDRTEGLEPGADRADRADDDVARSARSRGRFTRNFVIQASAADWALVLLAVLRGRLHDEAAPARLVFFQHDEIVVHAPKELAERVAELITESADEAKRLTFGQTPVRLPMVPTIVESYADAK
ncbi:bifunctional 3'-5' exonuclease/DNA polymerase [Yinghuangia seranimata]|uniref:bifunctional 3'-5' exonuclease/DNA polymerase n=1 Tax=Yinghuangia seranimata TaxID=408067 RepID=UPI00248CC14C|nr:bifunctional 3'-5' exonuclease/DNA polymerase [Yinghuangia seranimata]MDI2132309.1 bifunctional 3'-5' exonuclease/DNA polymerase [Yinghuangia seranimata]